MLVELMTQPTGDRYKFTPSPETKQQTALAKAWPVLRDSLARSRE